MGTFRELDNRKMRDRDASSGDRGNGGDLETLTSGTSVPVGTSGTEGYGDQDTGMGTGYSSGGQMAGSGRTGGGADAGDNSNMGSTGENDRNTGREARSGIDGGNRYSMGEPLPDSGGPDVSDMGENEPNTGYGKSSERGDARGSGHSGRATDMGNSGEMMGDSRAGADSGTSGVGMGTSTGGSSALDMGSSTGTGGNWGDPGASLGGGLSENTTTSGQN